MMLHLGKLQAEASIDYIDFAGGMARLFRAKTFLELLDYGIPGPENRALDAVVRRLRQKFTQAGLEPPINGFRSLLGSTSRSSTNCASTAGGFNFAIAWYDGPLPSQFPRAVIPFFKTGITTGIRPC
ncbi:hypothetical protein J2Y48_004782 [Mycoplana sp. BE70]|uniref:helix-turn-helix domain-containing protein n=1 Tax=Mycoplana sp. BE70 TaxID=2817775 RepID=UPI002854D561|nr:helix-turn-helix domain-containing protein [Mycoplana sp. BE70]MDR6759466.1 hypothetical protein [Mycoplana sp. BE70]